jgi:hypothetical protein
MTIKRLKCMTPKITADEESVRNKEFLPHITKSKCLSLSLLGGLLYKLNGFRNYIRFSFFSILIVERKD